MLQVDSEQQAALGKFLKRLLLRNDLSQAEQGAILALPGTISKLGAHRDQIAPGQLVDYSCLVVDGLAARFDQLANGMRQFTAVHLPGDMCDLHSVPAPLSGWGIEALAPTTFLRVPHKDLRALTVDYPAIAEAFWRDTIVDASILAKWISALGRRSAEARLAHLLCEIGLRMEQSGVGSRTQFGFRATQGHIADILGISAVHVNRSLQSLRARSLVRAEHFTYHIDDFEALAAFAEFDPAYLLLNEPTGEQPEKQIITHRPLQS
jgi:CRP-like cAMP-binding protein